MESSLKREGWLDGIDKNFGEAPMAVL